MPEDDEEEESTQHPHLLLLLPPNGPPDSTPILPPLSATGGGGIGDGGKWSNGGCLILLFLFLALCLVDSLARPLPTQRLSDLASTLSLFGNGADACSLASVSSLAPPLPALDPQIRSFPSCILPVYHREDKQNNEMNLEFLFGFMLDFLPSTCGCAVRPRMWQQFREDYFEAIGDREGDWGSKPMMPPPENLTFPLVYAVQMWGFDDISLLQVCALSPTWCRKNVILFHFADEHRWANLEEPTGGDLSKIIPYAFFHTVFRQYHKPDVDDYSYLAYDTLKHLGYSRADLHPAYLPSSAASTTSHDGFPHKAEAKRRLARLSELTPAILCPILTTPLKWVGLIDAIQRALNSHPNVSAILSPSDLHSDTIIALNEQLQGIVNASRQMPVTSPDCHQLALLSVFLHGQAESHDFAREKASNASQSNFTSSWGRRFGHVYWIPLGHTPVGIPAALKSGLAASSARRYLWSWSGSVKANPERVEFQQGMGPVHNQTTPQRKAMRVRGLFHDTERFAAGLGGVRWTGFLQDTTFMPLPAGNVADQYRVHEVFESGVIPVMADTHQVGGSQLLKWVRDLALDPAPLYPSSNFNSFLDAVFPLQFIPPVIIDAYQAITYHRYRLLMRSLRRTVAARICYLASRPISSQAGIGID